MSLTVTGQRAEKVVYVDFGVSSRGPAVGSRARRALLAEAAEVLCDSRENNLQVGWLRLVCPPTYRGVVLRQLGVAPQCVEVEVFPR